MVFILPVFFFGADSLFSAQTFYDSWLMLAFNLFFTSWPVLIFGLVDQDLPADALMECPKIYKSLLGNRSLSMYEFVRCSLGGFYQGVLVYYGTIWCVRGWHNELGLWMLGTISYTVCLVIISLQLAVNTRFWTSLTHLVIWGSLLFYALWLLLYCGVDMIFGTHPNACHTLTHVTYAIPLILTFPIPSPPPPPLPPPIAILTPVTLTRPPTQALLRRRGVCTALTNTWSNSRCSGSP